MKRVDLVELNKKYPKSWLVKLNKNVSRIAESTLLEALNHQKTSAPVHINNNFYGELANITFSISTQKSGNLNYRLLASDFIAQMKPEKVLEAFYKLKEYPFFGNLFGEVIQSQALRFYTGLTPFKQPYLTMVHSYSHHHSKNIQGDDRKGWHDHQYYSGVILPESIQIIDFNNFIHERVIEFEKTYYSNLLNDSDVWSYFVSSIKKLSTGLVREKFHFKEFFLGIDRFPMHSMRFYYQDASSNPQYVPKISTMDVMYRRESGISFNPLSLKNKTFCNKLSLLGSDCEYSENNVSDQLPQAIYKYQGELDIASNKYCGSDDDCDRKSLNRIVGTALYYTNSALNMKAGNALNSLEAYV